MKRAQKDELYSRSCLLAFETWANPISRSQLVPIGILVSSTATPSKPRSHQGQGCVLSSQVNHPSNMPATGLKLTDQDRVGDTLSEGLNRSGGTQRSTQNLTTKFSAEAAPSLNGQIRNRCRNLVNWWASCGSQAPAPLCCSTQVTHDDLSRALEMHLHHCSQSSRTIRCTYMSDRRWEFACRLQVAGCCSLHWPRQGNPVKPLDQKGHMNLF